MLVKSWPTHLDLPETDGLPVDNDYQPNQGHLLTSAIRPRLDVAHPAGDFAIGEDTGIYWKTTTDPLQGCKAPDWFYVSGCRPIPPGEFRRSYVLWDEGVAPTLVVEFVSGSGSEEHDDTPVSGRYWVYRRGVRAANYAIHDPIRETLEVFRLNGVDYRPVVANAAGVFEIPEMGVALGHWNGRYGTHELTWVRFFENDGRLIPHEGEVADEAIAKADEEKRRANRERRRANQANHRADQEKARADEEKARADEAVADRTKLLAKLKANGINPGSL